MVNIDDEPGSREPMTLDELLEIDNVTKNAYGSKTHGLVKLTQIINDGLPEGIFDYPLKVPDFFGIPTSVSLDDNDVRRAYSDLTSRLDDKRILMVRSSVPGEMPGEFESYPVLYDPANERKSFEKFISTARKCEKPMLIAKGESAITVQLLDEAEGTLKFYTDMDAKYDRDISEVKCFGAQGTSFYANSTNKFMSDNPIVSLSLGLGGKLARGDNDIVELYRGNDDVVTAIFRAKKNYHEISKAKFFPNSINVVDSSSTDDFSYVDLYEMHQMYFNGKLSMKGHTQIPVSSDVFKKISPNRFDVDNLLDLVTYLKEEYNTRLGINSEIEIEGYINENGVHLCQIRSYDLPSSFIKEKKYVSPDNILLETLDDYFVDKSKADVLAVKKSGASKCGISLGNNRFEGDLIVSDKLVDISDNEILYFTGDIYGYKTYSPEDFSKYAGKQLVFSAFNKETNGYPVEHSIGTTVNFLTQLEEIGVHALALNRQYETLLTGSEIDVPHTSFDIEGSSGRVYKNLGLECLNTEAKLYKLD